MVQFIPDPDLQQILPPLLSHIPAAFSSPKPPPSLPALLSPILRSRLQHLSFDNTPWLTLISWGNREDGEQLYNHLLEQDYFFLHDSSLLQSARCKLKGIRRVDEETIHMAVDVLELGVRFKYLFVVNDDNGEDDGWKLLDVRLLDDEANNGEDLDWYGSVAEAEDSYRSEGVSLHDDERQSRLKSLTQAMGGNGFVLNTNTNSQSNNAPAPAAGDEDDEDDYWGRYDDIEGSSSRGDEPSSSPVVSNDNDYYSRYDTVQPSMDAEDHPAESSATPMPVASSAPNVEMRESDESSNPQSARSSLYMTQTDMSTPPPPARTSTNVIEKLERQAELSVRAETAIKQHVSTSIKSLFRMWRAAGLERDEFEGAISREVEMLSMMEEED